MELVSIITSTYKNRSELIDRCIPSVKNQTWGNFEHIIVSDGEDPELREELAQAAKIDPYVAKHIRFFECGRNWRHFSHSASYAAMPRLLGTMVAQGDYITYLDDDDEFFPDHIETLVRELHDKDVAIAFSQMQVYVEGKPVDKIVGDGTVTWGNIGTPMVLHRAEALLHANWDFGPFYQEDIHLFKKWYDAGLTFSFVPKVTVKYHKREGEKV